MTDTLVQVVNEKQDSVEYTHQKGQLNSTKSDSNLLYINILHDF